MSLRNILAGAFEADLDTESGLERDEATLGAALVPAWQGGD